MLSLGFAIFFAVIVALLLVYAVWDTVRKKQRGAGYPESIELKDLRIIFPLIYILLSVGQILMQVSDLKKDTGLNRTSDIIVIVVWTVFMLWWLIFPLWTKVWLTPDGIITGSGKKGLVPIEDWQYELDGEKVLLYRKGIERPAKYKAQDAASLEKMLTEHYIKKI